MAFELLLSNYSAGSEPDAAKTIGTLLLFNTLTPPVTEALMRSTLEAGQPQPYSNDGWTALVTQLSNTSLQLSSLTPAERTIVNTLRTIVTPTPQSVCSGVATIVEVLTSVNAYVQTGFANDQHEFELVLDGTADGLSESVEVTLVPIGIAPAITTANPFLATFKQCENGDRLLSNIDVEFFSNPTGEAYTITNLNFLDADGVTTVTFAPSYNWNIP